MDDVYESRKKVKEFLKKKLSEPDLAKTMELIEDYATEYEREGVSNALMDY